MRSRLWKHTVCAAALSLLITTGAALAGDPDGSRTDCRKLVIGDSLENITISTEGPELTITMTENGKSKMTVVDLDQVGNLVGESLSELAESLAAMQLEFRLGHDNSVSFADGEQEWNLDVNALLAEVGQALDGAFADLDSESWATHHRVRHSTRIHHADQADLQTEMDALRGELKDLKQELSRLRKAQAQEDDR